MTQQTFTEEMRETAELDSVALANAQSLAALMAKYSLYIPAKEFAQWRPTQLSSGDIPGVALSVTIIATNGILGYFVFDDSSVPVLCGHTQCFTGKVEPLHSVQKKHKDSTTKTKRPRKSKLDLALELLKQLKEKI